MESVQNLKSNLESAGSGLLICNGKPEEVIPELARAYSAETVYWHEEATQEELEVEWAMEDALNELGVSFRTFWGSTLFHADDIPFGTDKIPDVFTTFRKKTEKHSRVRAEIPVPDNLPPLPVGLKITGDAPSVISNGKGAASNAKGVLDFRGGETEGLKRLHRYFWEGDCLRTYKETRNGLLGADYSSKFSPWLANGCLSPRRVYSEIKRYENERVANESTYWLIFELIWRDYFRFVFLKHENKLFQLQGIGDGEIGWKNDRRLFDAWAEGKTGIPFIDANMRELRETGFMSNRGRQNVAGFLSKNLKVDWRMGAEYFESMLIDYDVCSNWGNWAYISGTGNDPRNRFFDVPAQAKRYDPAGNYVRHWLPALRDVPSEFIHEPHTMDKAKQMESGIRIGEDYPHPLSKTSKTRPDL